MAKKAPSTPSVEAADKPTELLQPVPVRDHQIAIWFERKVLDTEQEQHSKRVNEHAASFAQVIKASTRNCPDQQRALAAVREAALWATQAIACKGR